MSFEHSEDFPVIPQQEMSQQEGGTNRSEQQHSADGKKRRSSSDRSEKLRSSRLYRATQAVTLWMDRYNVDGVAGLVPGGVGDIVSAGFAVVHVYFSAFRLRSIPLTLAILNNTLRDIFLGMLPFFVGDVIDFFHKANKRNMALIDGFINDDERASFIFERSSLVKLFLLFST